MYPSHKSINCSELVGLWHPQMGYVMRLSELEREIRWEKKGCDVPGYLLIHAAGTWIRSLNTAKAI